MENFARYYTEFLKEIFDSIRRFFVTLVDGFLDFFIFGFGKYFELLSLYTENFGFFGWILFILTALLHLGITIVVCYFIFTFLRKIFRFKKIKQSFEELQNISTNLENELIILNSQNNLVLDSKVKNNSSRSSKNNSNLQIIDLKDETIRFAKLLDVDRKYQEKPSLARVPRKVDYTLPELVQSFINFSASNLKLYYTKEIVSAFFAGLATSKIIILEGISGTGKTSLPYAFGKFLSHDAAIVSVQPSYRDKTELVGYLNEFTKKFTETDFLKALYEATYRKDPNLIVLDEMNLARIEYYFAEFLSILEMPDESEWKVDVVSKQLKNDPVKLINGKVIVPQNVWFIGTANKDDSTFAITDKVYDRAISIEINSKVKHFEADKTAPIKISRDSLEKIFNSVRQENPLSSDARTKLLELDKFITKHFKIMFGNRIMKQIEIFVPVYVGCGNSEYQGLDLIVSRKIVRKFETLNLPFLQNEITELITLIKKLFGKDEFLLTIKMIEDLRKQI